MMVAWRRRHAWQEAKGEGEEGESLGLRGFGGKEVPDGLHGRTSPSGVVPM